MAICLSWHSIGQQTEVHTMGRRRGAQGPGRQAGKQAFTQARGPPGPSSALGLLVVSGEPLAVFGFQVLVPPQKHVLNSP